MEALACPSEGVCHMQWSDGSGAASRVVRTLDHGGALPDVTVGAMPVDGSHTQALTCGGPRWCLSLGGGLASLWRDGVWQPTGYSAGALGAVDCPQPGVCLVAPGEAAAAGGYGAGLFVRLADARWTTGPNSWPGRSADLDCVDKDFCVTVGRMGATLVYGDSVIPAPQKGDAVACRSRTACLIADGGIVRW